MKSTVFLIASPALALFWIVPLTPSVSEPCRGAEIGNTIDGANQTERALVCEGARQALDLLDQCAIAPQRAIEVRIKQEVRHPLAGPIFGYYDFNERNIALTAFDSLPGLMRGTPYEGLSHREFYKSLVVHEIVHGVMHQTLGQPATSHAVYEYPAYALQIASLPADARARFLSTFDRKQLERTDPFSDVVLTFAPYLFAARAYSHFASSASGCTKLGAIMRGERDVAAAD